MRERVALRQEGLVGDLLVPARKAHRLEAEEADLLRIVQSKLDKVPHLLIVNAVNDRGHRDDVHAGLMQVVDGLQLYVKQVANLAVRVGSIADAVKLQVDITP